MKVERKERSSWDKVRRGGSWNDIGAEHFEEKFAAL